MVRASTVLGLCGLASATNYTLSLYDSASGALAGTLQSWSYGGVELKAQAPAGLPSSGQFAVSVAAGYDTQLNLHGSLVFEFGDMLELQLEVYGSGASQGATLELMQGDGATRAGAAVTLEPVGKGQWRAFAVPFSAFDDDLAKTQQLSGLHVSVKPSDGDAEGAALLLADVKLVARVPEASEASVTLSGESGREASPRLLGVNFGTRDGKWQPAYTTNRWGGNAMTRYAWDADIQNHAQDWFFEDIPNEVADEAALPFNSSSDLFVKQTLDLGAQAVLTIPTIGWAPKAERKKRCGFSVAKYGPQQKQDQYSPDCGNGVLQNGSFVTGDPLDTSRSVGPEYGVAWLDHLAEAFGKSAVLEMLYILDNEPNYWSGTHRDVHPDPLGYDELWNKTVAYSEALQAAYPGVRLMGPDISGMPDLFTRDCGEDCKAHESLPIIEWFIQQLGAHEQKTGVRLLEYLDIHCYPEAVRLQGAGAADLALRMRSTRELWDEAFFAESWHAMPMGYLRRLQRSIQQHAKWLKLSCTEFSYGLGDEDLVDAVLTLDALSIYAREGVDLATRWEAPAPGSATAYAYELLRLGNISGMAYVNATSTEPLLGAHGFRQGQRQALVLVCRQHQGQIQVSLDLGAAPSAQLYRLDADHVQASPEQLTVTKGKAQLTMPASSAALVLFSEPRASAVLV